MTETIVICLTAVLCSIILTGGINRAAFYLSKAIEKRDVFDLAMEALSKAKKKDNIIDIKRGKHE